MSAPTLAQAPTHDSDGDLVAASRVDTEVFGLLYDRYAAQIYRAVYRRLGDRADAEDVTADVFVRALTGLHTYRPARAPFPGWLHGIAAHAVIDHLRSRRRATPSGTVPLDAVPLDTVPLDPCLPGQAPPAGVEDQALHRIEAARVWRIVAGLPPAQRTAITLRLGDDLPIAVIAGRMDRTEGAVKLLLHRGLGSVRRQLTEAAA